MDALQPDSPTQPSADVPVASTPTVAPPPAPVAAPTPERRRGRLFRLARFYGLDIFDDGPLLGTPTTREMSYAALALTIVGVFELSAWTMLFYTVFTAGAWGLQPAYLPPAIFAGGLVASIVMVFEITFLTMDMHHRRWVIFGGIARVALILLSAFVTAQPVEALLFHQDVEERLYAQALQQEAVIQLEHFEEQIHQIDARSGFDPDRDGGVFVARKKAEEIEGRIKPQLDAIDADRIARIEAETARARHASLAASYGRTCDDPNAEDGPKARACRLEASQRARASTYAAKVQDLDVRIQIANERLGPDGKALDEARASVDAARKEAIRKHAEARQESLRGLDTIDGQLERLRRLVPPETVSLGAKEPGGARAWPKISAGLTHRLAIIDDLCACRTPSWPQGSERTRPPSPAQVEFLDRLARNQDSGLLLKWVELRREGASKRDTAAALFGLPEVAATSACTFPSLRDIYVRKYWAGLFIAIFLPAVSVLCKLLFNRLHAYYATVEQARLGNVDAQVLARAQGLVVPEDR